MTKRFMVSCLMMLAAFVCVTGLLQQSAKAETLVFIANLSAANEVPPVTGAESGTAGTATVTLTVTRDASNNITAATANFDIQLAGFPTSTTIILAHIHEGAAGVNGPIRVDSGISPGSSINLSAVGGNISRSGLTVTPSLAASIIANPVGFYFNVHSVANPGGLARGQLALAVISATGAPTLSEWGAILMTLLILSACLYFILGRSTAVFSDGAPAMVMSTRKAIDWQLYVKVALCVEGIVAIGLLVLRAGAVDVFGALASGLMLSFLLHLLIGSTKRR